MKTSRVPEKVLLEITNQCNLDCDYCYVDQEKNREMSVEELEGILKEIVTFNIPYVVISGGEPLVSPEHFNLFNEYVGFEKTLRTNGILLDKDMVDRIMYMDFLNVVVSLDGHKPDIHNKHRKNFQKSLRGVENLLKRDITVDIGVVITRDNFDQIESMHQFFEEMGINSINYQVMVPYRIRNTENLSINEEQKRWLRKFVIKKDKKPGMIVQTSIEVEDRLFLLKKNSSQKYPMFTCSAPFGAVYADGNGDLHSCVQLSDLVPPLGNITEEPMVMIWNSSSFQRALRKVINLEGNSRCEDCYLFEECRYECPAGILRRAVKIDKLPYCWLEVYKYVY